MALTGLVACATNSANPSNDLLSQDLDLNDGKQKVGYASGNQQMKALLNANTGLNREAFMAGMGDALYNQPAKIAKPELEQSADWQQLAQINLDAIKQTVGKPGKAFLAKNQTDPEVKTLKSGLQYKVIKPGNGKATPKLTDTVQFLFRFSKIDGSDLTKDALPGKTFRKAVVSRLPKGLQEAVLLMTKGEEWQLFLPPDLMYGDVGALASGVLPNETLICDLELDFIAELPK